MRRKLIVFVLLLSLCTAANAGNSGLLRWEFLFCNTVSNQYYDNLYGADIAIDPAGFVYSLGYGEKQVGGKTDRDVVITKLDSTNLLVQKFFTLPDTSNDVPKKLILTTAGQLYLLVNSNSSTHPNSCEVYCLDNNLNVLWTNTFVNTVGNGDDYAEDMVVDATGNVTVAGTFTQTAQGKNIFIHRVLSTQQVVNKVYNNTNSTLDEGVSRLKLDPDGSLYLCGYQAMATKGNQFLLIKYKTNLAIAFKKLYNGQNGVYDDVADDVAIDANKNIYLTGRSYKPSSGMNAVTLKYDSAGTVLWTKREYGSTEGRRIIVNNNFVYVACEGFKVYKYDAAGTLQLQFTPPYGTHVNDFEMDVDGNLFVGGKKDTLVGTTLSNEGCLLRWNSAGVIKTKLTLPAVLDNGVVHPAEVKNIAIAFDGLFSMGNKYSASVAASYCMKTQKFARNLARLNNDDWMVNETAISVYPNPVTDALNILAPALSKISLYDRQGKLVTDLIAQGYSTTIDMSNLKPALYLICIESGDKRTTQKIIKQ